jgi:hypothetical protein
MQPIMGQPPPCSLSLTQTHKEFRCPNYPKVPLLD